MMSFHELGLDRGNFTASIAVLAFATSSVVILRRIEDNEWAHMGVPRSEFVNVMNDIMQSSGEAPTNNREREGLLGVPPQDSFVQLVRKMERRNLKSRRRAYYERQEGGVFK